MAFRRKLTAALLALGVAMALSGSAIAQETTGDDGYARGGEDVGGLVQGGADSGGGGGGGQGNVPAAGGADTGDRAGVAAAPQGDGSLPFTGFDLVLIVGAGAMLLGLGLGMRRVLRAANTA